MSPHSDVALNGSDSVLSNGINGHDSGVNSRIASPMVSNGYSRVNHGSHDNGTNISVSNGSTLSHGNTIGSGNANGYPATKPKARSSPHLSPAPLDSDFDLICVGFGPASLSIAIAMHDAIAAGAQLLPGSATSAPKLLFIEKQNRFSWHAGMLIPGAKMQISFIKDLATLRNPRSEFTFLNYLHSQGRLIDFTNLNTFLPSRVEFEDYLRWCSSHFDHLAQFGQQVVSVAPETPKGASPSYSSHHKVGMFVVEAQDVDTGASRTYRGRNVLVATGGQPSLPRNFPLRHPRVIHSSQYANRILELLPRRSDPYHIAIVGAGQSAAEIFNNLHTLYPNCKTSLIMRPEFLRPSDDSPFVNSVFNPEYIDCLFPKSAKYRNNLLTEARATNYGVVRLELIEELYERMYDQKRVLGDNETLWPHRIIGGRQVTSVESRDDGLVELRVQHVHSGEPGFTDAPDSGHYDANGCETMAADLVIAATGYQRNAHVDMLRETWDLLPKAYEPRGLEFGKGISGWNVDTDQGERKLAVGRDYRVKFAPGSVADDAGIWLQGCCEGTHGLSDTLLSVLATRSGEMVDSIFGRHVDKPTKTVCKE
ncbi:hypothetical protein CDD81_5373 [Ophiocordyceps australis]|uniref:L-ornithine N(5)-monooxygenase [NAD(P)H] n=1 Tax=Ophiocordyceps australis TaxID=1399860 RepID=A0A2C5Y371_9HYPO|nr:hypothetical protein CDD81_5373 [Ophiocordyceps australis]